VFTKFSDFSKCFGVKTTESNTVGYSSIKLFILKPKVCDAYAFKRVLILLKAHLEK